MEVMSFMLAGRLCGVDVGMVREITPAPVSFTRVPGAPEPVVGLYNLRGRIIPAICLRRCLGLAVGPRHAPDFCLVVEYKGELYSLAVDEAGGVLSLDSANAFAGPAPDERWHEAVTLNVRLEEGQLSLLDVQGLLDGLCRPEQ